MPSTANRISISLISLIFISLLNIASSISYAVVAKRQISGPLGLESGNGFVYFAANPPAVTTSSQSTTSAFSLQGSSITAAQPAQTSGTLLGQNPSSTAKDGSGASVTPTSSSVSTFAGAASSHWPSSITFVSESSGVPVVGIAFVTTISGTSFITNTEPKQSLINTAGSASGQASVTEGNSATDSTIGQVASTGGNTATGSTISQVAITQGGTATGFALGQVVITEGDTTTTLQLASLPTASTLPQPSGVQVVSESGSPVIYSPITLSGYSNTEPIEISTTFVEIINGQTTTQGGLWLIGALGVIDPPNNRPWKVGGNTVGCIGGPLFCNTQWVDIGGGFGVQLPGPVNVGPPGYPGGPVNGVEDPENPPPPYSGSDQDPEDDPDENQSAELTSIPNDEKTASEQENSATASSPQSSMTSYSKMSTSRMSSSANTTTKATTSRMTTFSASVTTRATSSSSVSTSAPRAQYFINAAVNASQEEISALLQAFDPNSKNKSYAPDIGATPADGGFWVGYNLTLDQAQNISQRSDILMINTYTDTPLSSTTAAPVTVISDTDSVTLWTLMSNTTSTRANLSPSATSNLKIRNERHDSLSGSRSYIDRTRNITAELETNDLVGRNLIQPRDVGTRLVRQGLSPKDLSVLSQKPGVPNVRGVDYVFVETKGEGTWTYLIDNGVNALHQEFRGNWPGAYGKFNIDSNIIYDYTDPYLRDYISSGGGDVGNGHGTCLASKICGKRCGPAKQATIISCVISADFKSFLFVLDRIIEDIQRRWRLNPRQALPGKTTVSISQGWKSSQVGGQRGINDMLAKFKAINNLGAVIAVAAGNANDPNNPDYYEGFSSSDYPPLLAVTTMPSLIRVGAVDLTGAPTVFSQEGDVYTVGLDAPCANYATNLWETESDGTSGATATFVGDMVYRMSLPGNVFGFGNDISQYQQKVKDFYTVGYSRRNPSLHPKGAYRRSGQYANVVWNGQDGRASTVCPLLVHPGAFKKRDISDPSAESELEPADICTNYTASASSTSHNPTTQPTTDSSTIPSSSFACTQVFYFESDSPNNFVCQCTDGTWSHINELSRRDAFSECPNQITSISLTTALPSATIPASIPCTEIIYEPTSANYLPFCQCANNIWWPDACPTSVHAPATTTLTFSEPPASVTAVLTRDHYVTPSPSPVVVETPSPVESACVPQCTRHVQFEGPQDGIMIVNCDCNPACGGNAHPNPNSDNECPNQVGAIKA